MVNNNGLRLGDIVLGILGVIVTGWALFAIPMAIHTGLLPLIVLLAAVVLYWVFFKSQRGFTLERIVMLGLAGIYLWATLFGGSVVSATNFDLGGSTGQESSPPAGQSETAETVSLTRAEMDILSAADDAGLTAGDIQEIGERASVELCSVAIFGDALKDPNAREIHLELPQGYTFAVTSSDQTVMNGHASGKGHLTITEGDDLVILTKNANANGVGWNNENDRWNISGCLLPDNVDPWKYLADLQLGDVIYGGGNSGEGKPVGLYFHNGQVEQLWESDAESEEVLAQYRP